jgi:uncharacterized protein (TIGR02996 family)
MVKQIQGKRGFLTTIQANPRDRATRLIFADWLDEHDQPAEAADQRRKAAQCLRFDPDFNYREALEAIGINPPSTSTYGMISYVLAHGETVLVTDYVPGVWDNGSLSRYSFCPAAGLQDFLLTTPSYLEDKDYLAWEDVLEFVETELAQINSTRPRILRKVFESCEGTDYVGEAAPISRRASSSASIWREIAPGFWIEQRGKSRFHLALFSCLDVDHGRKTVRQTGTGEFTKILEKVNRPMPSDEEEED